MSLCNLCPDPGYCCRGLVLTSDKKGDVTAKDGTLVAVVKRNKILNQYSRQMAERRETMVRSIDEHLRHALRRFYLELEQTFQPLEAFCTAQKKVLDPLIARVRKLEDTLGQCAAGLGAL